MPCNSCGMPAVDTTGQKLDRVTDMLCQVLGTIERQHGLVNGRPSNRGTGADFSNKVVVSASVMKWWKEHKKIDEARLERERQEEEVEEQRLAALAKLTAAERKLLGLK